MQDNEIESILFEDRYTDEIKPQHLVKNLEELKEFCKKASIEDLICFLEVCNEEELYEYSQYINTLL